MPYSNNHLANKQIFLTEVTSSDICYLKKVVHFHMRLCSFRGFGLRWFLGWATTREILFSRCHGASTQKCLQLGRKKTTSIEIFTGRHIRSDRHHLNQITLLHFKLMITNMNDQHQHSVIKPTLWQHWRYTNTTLKSSFQISIKTQWNNPDQSLTI